MVVNIHWHDQHYLSHTTPETGRQRMFDGLIKLAKPASKLVHDGQHPDKAHLGALPGRAVRVMVVLLYLPVGLGDPVEIPLCVQLDPITIFWQHPFLHISNHLGRKFRTLDVKSRLCIDVSRARIEIKESSKINLNNLI